MGPKLVLQEILISNGFKLDKMFKTFYCAPQAQVSNLRPLGSSCYYDLIYTMDFFYGSYMKYSYHSLSLEFWTFMLLTLVYVEFHFCLLHVQYFDCYLFQVTVTCNVQLNFVKANFIKTNNSLRRSKSLVPNRVLLILTKIHLFKLKYLCRTFYASKHILWSRNGIFFIKSNG